MLTKGLEMTPQRARKARYRAVRRQEDLVIHRCKDGARPVPAEEYAGLHRPALNVKPSDIGR